MVAVRVGLLDGGPMEATETLGELVRRLRLRKGWSQAELARRVGTKAEYISQIETGKRGWPETYVDALARVLDVRLSELGRAAGRIIKDAQDGVAVHAVRDEAQIKRDALREVVDNLDPRKLDYALTGLQMLHRSRWTWPPLPSSRSSRE